MRKTKLLLVIFYILTFSGCATIPKKEALPTYQINGTSYFPLLTLCDIRDINWQYDTYTKTIVLENAGHSVSLRVGDSLALVDGSAQHLKHPIDIYQGTIVAPYKFKEQILDTLFKEKHPQPQAVTPILKIKRIVIDAGHGGNDPGAIGSRGLREKDVNLDIAKRLSTLLRQRGIEVIMTRSSDRFIPLSRRVEIANAAGADIFLSIHSNANRVRSLNGFEVYYVSPSVSDSKRAYAAARTATLDLDNAYFAGNSLDLKATLWDMIYTSSRGQSIELSRAIAHSMADNLSLKILGIKAGRFEVLRGIRMPGVLIEVGFLSNYNEESRLRNGYYRQQIAESITEGVERYAKQALLLEVAKR